LHPALKRNVLLALKDLKDGICSIYIWPTFGWLEIKQRYRRSVLGPFWLTISTGVMIAAMGPLYSRLLAQSVSIYFSYLAISLVIWVFISGLLTDACNTFISAEGYIKQMKLPLTVHVMRMVWKNLLIFAHNLAIILIVLVFFRPEIDWHVVLVPVGILLIAANGIWVGIFLGLLCARFRDIPPIIANFVQVAFFLTPIFWTPALLGRHQWVVNVNPLFHFLEIVRRPLMGEGPSLLSWALALVITVVGFTLMLAFFQRFRARIAYWV
jgi:ABC-type polysaccharide/polyol phosphate export permease